MTAPAVSIPQLVCLIEARLLNTDKNVLMVKFIGHPFLCLCQKDNNGSQSFWGQWQQHVGQLGTVVPVKDQGGLYQSGSSGGESGYIWNIFYSRTNKTCFLIGWGWVVLFMGEIEYLKWLGFCPEKLVDHGSVY